MQMYLIGASTGALGFAMLFVDWRLMFVPWVVGGLLCAALSLAADARERHAQPFLAIDRDGIRFGTGLTTHVPWHAIGALRFLSKTFGPRGPYFGIAIADPELFSRLSDFEDRARAFVLDKDEIHIPIQEIDATRDDIRNIVAHYRLQLTPP
jgi:hypothetical protein